MPHFALGGALVQCLMALSRAAEASAYRERQQAHGRRSDLSLRRGSCRESRTIMMRRIRNTARLNGLVGLAQEASVAEVIRSNFEEERERSLSHAAAAGLSRPADPNSVHEWR